MNENERSETNTNKDDISKSYRRGEEGSGTIGLD